MRGMWSLPYGAGQICVREDLISKELSRLEERYNQSFSKQKLSNKFLDWLFRRYGNVGDNHSFL